MTLKEKTSKLEIFLSVIAVFTITLIGIFLLHAENIDNNIIKMPENEIVEIVALNININTATKEELMLLRGIGEYKADSIIKYRQNKPFSSIEEIKNVYGIGDEIFENIKDFICVE